MTVNTKVQAFKKTLIIETAQDFFSQRPYEAVTVEEIAKAAGFGKSTVYLFFESKEEILVAVLQSGLERLSENFFEISEGERDVRVALRSIIALQYDFYMEFGSIMFTYSQKYRTGAVKAEWHEAIRQMLAKKLSYLAHLMQRGMQQGVIMNSEPDYLAWLVNTMIKGVCLPSMLLKNETRDRKKDIEMLQTIILNGVMQNN